MAAERPQSNPLQRVIAPIARAGLRGAQGLARRLGLDRAVDRGVDRALDSDTAAKATERLLKSDTANRVWDKVLESDEAQKLVERVADAPEMRDAITSQGIGLVEDLRRGVRRAVRQFDTLIETGGATDPSPAAAGPPPDLRRRIQQASGPGDRRGNRLRGAASHLRRDRVPDHALRTRRSNGGDFVLAVGALAALIAHTSWWSSGRARGERWECRSSRFGSCPRTEASEANAGDSPAIWMRYRCFPSASGTWASCSSASAGDGPTAGRTPSSVTPTRSWTATSSRARPEPRSPRSTSRAGRAGRCHPGRTR